MALLLTPPVFRAFTPNGALAGLAGGRVYGYEPGTTTPKPLYSDLNRLVPYPHPVILDATGSKFIVLGEGAYKIDVRDANDVSLPGYPMDGVQGEQSESIVGTISELRSLAPGEYPYVTVTGYYVAGDGKAFSNYYWDPTSTAADNGTNIIKPLSDPAAGRYVAIISGSEITPYNGGAIGNGVADDSLVVSTVDSIAAANGLTLLFDKGTFLISSALNILADVKITKGRIKTGANTVTFYKHIEAGPDYIFELGTGKVSLRLNVECYPEWWGAVADGVVDCTNAILEAGRVQCPYVLFSNGDYKCSPIFWGHAEAVLSGLGYSALSVGQFAGPLLGRKVFVGGVNSKTGGAVYKIPFTPGGTDMASNTGNKSTRIVLNATARAEFLFKLYGAQEFIATNINFHGKLFADNVFWMTANCLRCRFNYVTFEHSTPVHGTQLFLGDPLVNSQVDFNTFHDCSFLNPNDGIESTDQLTLYGNIGVKILQTNTIGNVFVNGLFRNNRIHFELNGSSDTELKFCDFSKYREWGVFCSGLSYWTLDNCYTEVQFDFGTVVNGFLQDNAAYSTGGPASVIRNCRLQGINNLLDLTANKAYVISHSRISGTSGITLRAPTAAASSYYSILEHNSLGTGSNINDPGNRTLQRFNAIGGVTQPDKGPIYNDVTAGIVNRKLPVQFKDFGVFDNDSGSGLVVKNVDTAGRSLQAGHAVQANFSRSNSRITFSTTTTAAVAVDEDLSGNMTERLRVDSYGILARGLQLRQGTNLAIGTATLAAGTVTVNNTRITANTMVLLETLTAGGTVGFLRVSARVAGTSFTILSSSGSDTSVVQWALIEPVV